MKKKKGKNNWQTEKATDKQIKFILDLSDQDTELFIALPKLLDEIGVHDLSLLTKKDGGFIIANLLKLKSEPAL
jgi:hypothetical protein